MSARHKTLTNLVSDTASTLAEYARWPDVAARQEAVDADIVMLRDAIKGHDNVVVQSLLISVLLRFIMNSDYRDTTSAGMRKGLIKLADLLYK